MCQAASGFLRDDLQSLFVKCANCGLNQKTNFCFPAAIEEKEHYSRHNNGPQYPAYVKFLKKAIDPLLPYLDKNMQALDYGCGPGPAISHVLQGYGIFCDNYDPFFFQNGIKSTAYDLIFATECLEHFHNPLEELLKITTLLKKGGYLSIMTVLYHRDDQFPDWYYTKDPTHVSFYHLKTIQWMEKSLNLKRIISDGKRVFVSQKQ
ncbi:hypothetical protein P872_10355 [Rhodonellum psychrophilum GCM71 = DSM 17998]|uniref:2-polyprenyl-3-methyl-5-hydroxy-6-metoxy-1, 4-benzoquinol methylase n=2 Tax=Rhodonellum TaxID=336827 RepID=U5BY04_9BACT|nr:hypothetical protein P872_10355 [Rhodonellum psychrophilum GCM71 = DSM 17998]SDZ29221.1 Methyltransferase domain-containing protein [Rhodonellum ikkaensis]